MNSRVHTVSLGLREQRVVGGRLVLGPALAEEADLVPEQRAVQVEGIVQVPGDGVPVRPEPLVKPPDRGLLPVRDGEGGGDRLDAGARDRGQRGVALLDRQVGKARPAVGVERPLSRTAVAAEARDELLAEQDAVPGMNGTKAR